MALKSIHTHLERVSRIAAICGGLGIIGISVMITVDVFLRKFVGATLGGASEISGMVFAMATAMAYPYVLLDRANIRIDVMYSRLSPKLRAFLDFAAMIAVAYFGWMLSSSVYGLFSKSWKSGAHSVGVVQIPLWIPQSIWVFGIILFTATAVFLCLYSLAGLLRRDWPLVNRVAGIPSIDETIEEETHIDDAPSVASEAAADNEEHR